MTAIRSAALVVVGAALASPWPQEYRGSLLAGAFAVLLYLARHEKAPPDDGEGL